MDVRLVQLLSSFIGARGRYALARLEFALRHDDMAAPPVIDRLPDASASSLRASWPSIAGQLEKALVYTRRLERLANLSLRDDVPFHYLRGTVREMDQYARAVNWVRTVTALEE